MRVATFNFVRNAGIQFGTGSVSILYVPVSGSTRENLIKLSGGVAAVVVARSNGVQ